MGYKTGFLNKYESNNSLDMDGNLNYIPSINKVVNTGCIIFTTIGVDNI